ncbi:hypothetical protein [Senegalia massiliensis]|nr:hypothetical protein [Senegalia massiliensis]
MIMFVIILLSSSVYAEQDKGVKNKLDEQNKLLKEKLNDTGLSKEEEVESTVDNMIANSKETKKTTFADIKRNLTIIFLKIALGMRKYSVFVYMFIIVTNVIMINFLGAKSLQKRRKYILMSFFITILFIVVMNIPIVILYFQNNPMHEILTADKMANSLISFISFLQANSLALCLILYLYGFVNELLGDQGNADVPRKTTGAYFKKTAIITFIVLQTLPVAINFII